MLFIRARYCTVSFASSTALLASATLLAMLLAL